MRRPAKEPTRLAAVSKKRAARIAAGAERPGMKRSRMRRGKGDNAYARRPRDFGRMLFVKSLYCYVGTVYGSEGCSRIIEAHHAGKRGLGQKAPDDTCIPLCVRHHRQATDYSGFFSLANWPAPGSRAAFVEGAIADTRAAWDALSEAEQARWYEMATATSWRHREREDVRAFWTEQQATIPPAACEVRGCLRPAKHAGGGQHAVR